MMAVGYLGDDRFYHLNTYQDFKMDWWTRPYLFACNRFLDTVIGIVIGVLVNIWGFQDINIGSINMHNCVINILVDKQNKGWI